MPETPDPLEPPTDPPPVKKRRVRRKKAIAPPAPPPEKTLTDIILDSAAEPKSATVDGQTVQARDLREMIEAERYLASKKAMRRPGGGLRITKMTHSGAT